MIDTDTKWMIDLKNGDDSGFEKIIEKYETPLLNLIYRFIGNSTDAEDVLQEVFLKIYRAKERYKPTALLSTWIYKIATTTCIDYIRKYKKHNISIASLIQQVYDNNQQGDNLPDVTAEPLDKVVEQKQVRQIIEQNIMLLPEKQRLALILRVYENKSYNEIAQIIGCSVSAVESLIFRARQYLKTRLAIKLFD